MLAQRIVAKAKSEYSAFEARSCIPGKRGYALLKEMSFEKEEVRCQDVSANTQASLSALPLTYLSDTHHIVGQGLSASDHHNQWRI